MMLRDDFGENLDDMVRVVVKNSSFEEILMVMLAQLEGGFERVHEGFGYGELNQEGEDILNFVIAYDLMVANTFFRKKKSHLITFSSGQHSSQIDFLLIRREERPNCINYKVISGECVVTHHKLLVVDFYFKVCIRRDKDMKIMRTRWWKLKGDISQVFKNKVIVEGSWNECEDADNIWKEMSTHIRKVTIEVFGVTKGNKREPKDTWCTKGYQ
jgi:hypothetical protein